MKRSEKATPIVFAALSTAAIVGLVLVFSVPADSASGLLVVDIFAIAALVALSVFVARKTGQLKAAQYGIRMQERSPWLFFSRGQWMAMTVGVTAIATVVGLGAGVRMVSASTVGTPPSAPAYVAPPPTTAPVAAPVVTTGPPTPVPTSDPPTSAPPTGDPSPTDSGTPVPSPGATTYMDSIDVVNGDRNVGAVSLSGKRYPRSITMYCQRATSDYVEWNVAGYQAFTTTVGVPDDASNAFNGIAEMIFYDQDGRQLAKPFDVSVGHAAPVSLDVKGIVHLRVTCSSRDSKTNQERSFYGALGDAILTN